MYLFIYEYIYIYLKPANLVSRLMYCGGTYDQPALYIIN
jgi:hypothetical protein